MPRMTPLHPPLLLEPPALELHVCQLLLHSRGPPLRLAQLRLEALNPLLQLPLRRGPPVSLLGQLLHAGSVLGLELLLRQGVQRELLLELTNLRGRRQHSVHPENNCASCRPASSMGK